MMTFSTALIELKNGKRISRSGWNGKDQYIMLALMKSCITDYGELINDPAHADIGTQFLMFVGSRGYQCGWVPSQADILADDWIIL